MRVPSPAALAPVTVKVPAPFGAVVATAYSYKPALLRLLKPDAAPPEGSRAALTPESLKGETRPEALRAAKILNKRMLDSEFQPDNLKAAAVIGQLELGPNLAVL